MKKISDLLISRRPLTIIFISLNIIFYFISQIYISTNYEYILKQNIFQKQKMVEEFFRYPESIINIISRNSSLETFEDDNNNRLLVRNILSLFESVNISDSRICNLYYVSNNGEYISYDNDKKKAIDLTKTDWFKKAIDSKTRIIWVTHKSDFTGSEVISCTRQISDKYGKPIGVIGLDIKLHRIHDMVDTEDEDNSGISIILDNENKIIADTDYTCLGEHIADSSVSNINNSFFLKFNRSKYKCVGLQFEKLPWKLIYAVPVNDIRYSIVKWSILFIFLSLISFVLVCRLIIINEKLKKHAEVIEELAAARERNRLAIDIHDSLGHTMTVLIAMIDTMYINSEKKDIKENLAAIAEIARNGLKELRQSVSSIAVQKNAMSSLVKKLRNLVAEYEATGLKIDLSIDGNFNLKNPEYCEAIFRSCQEAMTNALRHGKATNIDIILQVSEDDIRLFIFDDGMGCKNIKKGFGLSGMEQRIKGLNGSIIYGSNGEKGFNINIELPLVQ